MPPELNTNVSGGPQLKDEYISLRGEINEYFRLTGQVHQWSVAGTIAILSTALTLKNAILCLMPLILMSASLTLVAGYCDAIARIAAYIRWRHEALRDHETISGSAVIWETMLDQRRGLEPTKKRSPDEHTHGYSILAAYILLAAACIFMTAWLWFVDNDMSQSKSMPSATVAFVSVPTTAQAHGSWSDFTIMSALIILAIYMFLRQSYIVYSHWSHWHFDWHFREFCHVQICDSASGGAKCDTEEKKTNRVRRKQPRTWPERKWGKRFDRWLLVRRGDSYDPKISAPSKQG